MGKSIRVKLNRGTVRRIARGGEMQALVVRVAKEIQSHANSIGATDGFEVDNHVGKNRARARVVSGTNEARRAEATNRALSKAKGAAGY